MATLWERVAHSVNRMFFLNCVYLIFSYSNFGFEDGTSVLTARFSSHCFPFYFELSIWIQITPSVYWVMEYCNVNNANC